MSKTSFMTNKVLVVPLIHPRIVTYNCRRIKILFRKLKPLFYLAHYAEAMKEGSVPAAYFRLMSLGAGGSGKSSLLDGLMNIPLQIAESTALADTRRVIFSGSKQQMLLMKLGRNILPLMKKEP